MREREGRGGVRVVGHHQDANMRATPVKLLTIWIPSHRCPFVSTQSSNDSVVFCLLMSDRKKNHDIG